MGPSLLLAARYTTSPVGPYIEMGVAEPARLGVRPGWSVTVMGATSADARVAGQMSWGFPKQLADLTWDDDGSEIRVSWPDRGLVLRAWRGRMRVPVWLPTRSLQHRADGPVVIPGSMRGWMRPSRALVEPSDGPESWLAGPHRALMMDGARFVTEVARLPSGALSTLRAPLRAPEPGPASMRNSRGA